MDKTAQYAEAAALFKQAVAEGADEATARAAYDAAVSRIASTPDAPAAPAAAPATPMSLKDKVVGGVRAVGQGLGMGYGDEIEGAARSLSPDVTYEDARDKIRNENARFREAYPKAALASEVGGGIVGAGKLMAAAKGVGFAARAAGLLTNPFVQGAISGTGASESGDVGGVLQDGAIGGAFGGAAGWAGGKVASKLAETAKRARGTKIARKIGKLGEKLPQFDDVLGATPWSETSTDIMPQRVAQSAGKLLQSLPQGDRAPTFAGRRAVTALTGKMNGQVTPEVLAAAAGSNTAKGAVILDNMGFEGERVARGMRTRGGEAGNMVERWADSRLRTAPDKMVDAIYNGETPDNVFAMTKDIAQKAKDLSAPLYDRFRAMPPVYTPEIEEMLTRPLMKEALKTAAKSVGNLNPEQRAKILGGGVQLSEKQIAKLRTPAFLDEVKKAAGDIVYSKKTPVGPGGLRPHNLSREKNTIKEFTDRLDDVFTDPVTKEKVYKSARDAWAGQTELNEGLQDGMEAIGNPHVTDDEIRDMVGELSGTTHEMFKRGVKAQLRATIETGGLKPAATEQRAFMNKVEAALGKDEARVVLTRIRDEVAAVRSAQMVKLGSQTADKTGEAVNPLAPESSSAWASGLYNPGRTAANLAGRYLSDLTAAPLGAAIRTEATKMLLSPANDPTVTKRLMQELAAQNLGKQTAKTLRGPLATATNIGMFSRPYREDRR